jgi:putative redox protein
MSCLKLIPDNYRLLHENVSLQAGPGYNSLIIHSQEISMESKVVWVHEMEFENDNRGITSRMDSSPDFGGHNKGPTPKEAVLNAMCACAGIDVVSITKKMRLVLNSFKMEATATKTKTIPSYFGSVHIRYYLEGQGESEKFINAITLSMTKYCGVSYMISKACPITYEIYLNQQLIHKDEAKFTLEAVV